MQNWIVIGILNAFISVAAGAFGAHALRARLAPDLLAIFETGARYQMYHSIALVLLGLFVASRPSALANGAGIALTLGIVLFSGSLYALALTGIRGLGAVTPLGGLGFLAGWAMFAVAAWRK